MCIFVCERAGNVPNSGLKTKLRYQGYGIDCSFTFNLCNSLMGPTPDNISILGVFTAPADRTTSLLARTRLVRPMKSNSTPVARLLSKSIYKIKKNSSLSSR